MMFSKQSLLCLWIIFFNLWLANVFAIERSIDLIIDYKIVNFSGKATKALAVNNQIPGPILHFQEGDEVTINVYNRLDKGTTMHWHGLLLPWQMDGVEGITQKAIPPGGKFQYKFKLKQSGTYWYHAHSGFQKQQGLYGGIIIDPLQPTPYQYTKDYTIVLSDWHNTLPENIYKNLKKDGDYYSPKFPIQPSLMHFIQDYRNKNLDERRTLINDYKIMQQMRMNIYDFSDVAYEAFLLNGHSITHPWTKPVTIGDMVRLRFIGAGSNTIFRVKIEGTSMQVVHVQGNDVKPYIVNDFTITPGETYDVLVKIRKKSPYIIYAEPIDTGGKVYGALLSYPQKNIDWQVTPFPAPLPVTKMGMPEMINGRLFTTGTKYQALTAAHKTNDPDKPVEMIKMVLSGYMDRYVWFINGVPAYQAKPIVLEPNKRYRIIFINASMMHHPMHLHGHWFILRNGHGEKDPLLHTIDVAPGATVVADVDADADGGQWFFHCHQLYHMKGGMARLFQYKTLLAAVDKNTINQAEKDLVKNATTHSQNWYNENTLEAGADLFHNTQTINFKSSIGSDFHKLELLTKDAELNKGRIENADMDIFYWHLLSQFWVIKGGVNYFYRPAQTPYWQPGLGIEGLMPYFIDTDLRTYCHKGSIKLDLDLSRDIQITNNFFMRAGVRSIFASKTITEDEIGSGLNQMQYTLRSYYRINPGWTLYIEFEHEEDHGRLRTIRRNLQESIREDSINIGFSVLF